MSAEQFASKFRGTWIPAEVHEALREGKITPTEVVLLTVIDSLVDPRGEGCWASNAYLAKQIHKSVIQTKRLIGHLLRIKMLVPRGWKTTNQNRFRLLETAWSRGGRGIIDDTTGRIASDTTGGIANDTHTKDSINILRPPQVEAVNGNGKPAIFGQEKPSQASQLANQFHEEVVKAGKLQRLAKLSQWTAAVTNLLQHKNLSTIKRAIGLHFEHLNDEYWPQFYSLPRFCQEFARIEHAIKRLGEDEPIEEEQVERTVIHQNGKTIIRSHLKNGWGS